MLSGDHATHVETWYDGETFRSAARVSAMSSAYWRWLAAPGSHGDSQSKTTPSMCAATTAFTVLLTQSARTVALSLKCFSGCGAAITTRAPAACAWHMTVEFSGHATVVTRLSSAPSPAPKP